MPKKPAPKRKREVIDTLLAKRLATTLRDKKITITAASKRVDHDRSTLTRMLRGERRIPVAVVRKLAAMLGVEIATLVDGTPTAAMFAHEAAEPVDAKLHAELAQSHQNILAELLGRREEVVALRAQCDEERKSTEAAIAEVRNLTERDAGREAALGALRADTIRLAQDAAAARADATASRASLAEHQRQVADLLGIVQRNHDAWAAQKARADALEARLAKAPTDEKILGTAVLAGLLGYIGGSST